MGTGSPARCTERRSTSATGRTPARPAWEGVAAHEVIETDGVAVVVVGRRNRGDDGPVADGSRMQTR